MKIVIADEGELLLVAACNQCEDRIVDQARPCVGVPVGEELPHPFFALFPAFCVEIHGVTVFHCAADEPAVCSGVAGRSAERVDHEVNPVFFKCADKVVQKIELRRLQLHFSLFQIPEAHIRHVDAVHIIALTPDFADEAVDLFVRVKVVLPDSEALASAVVHEVDRAAEPAGGGIEAYGFFGFALPREPPRRIDDDPFDRTDGAGREIEGGTGEDAR